MSSNAFQTKWKFRDVPKTYARLVAWHPPRPIRNEADLQAATVVIDAMAGHQLSRDQDDYLDLLSTLVSEYEDAHHPVKARDLSPLEALKCLLEESGMSASALGRLLGNREVGPKILRGERELTVKDIAALSEHFAMSPEFFIPRAAARARVQMRRKCKSGSAWRPRDSLRSLQNETDGGTI